MCYVLLIPLQVTPVGVWVLSKQGYGLQQSWTSHDSSPISLAAASGSRLVVACGDSITAFNVNCCTGALVVIGVRQLQQQASALALLTLTGEVQLTHIAPLLEPHGAARCT